MIAAVEVSRIGYNEITGRYAVDTDQRLLRYQALMESLIYTFIEPRGAMRGSQRPHLVNFEGVIGVSTQRVPAPTVSPLNDHYRESLENVRAALDPLHPGAVSLLAFDDIAGFSAHMTTLVQQTVPFDLSA